MSAGNLSPLPLAAPGASFGADPRRPQFGSALPVSDPDEGARWFPPLVVMPSVPAAGETNSENYARSWPPPLAAMPSATSQRQAASESPPETLPEIQLPPESSPPISAPAPPAQSPLKAAPDFTDEDLAEAFAPMMRTAARSAIYASEKASVDAMLEPMLRATVRRALAEYTPASRPFQPPGFIDKTVWRFQALFSSRTFEDVLFEKTHRFQIDEVYLLDAESLALVSFASCDPARHSTARRVGNSAQRIAIQIRDENGGIRRSFEQSDGRNVISEAGEFMVLVAVVRGQPNDMILQDLEYSLRRIEEHFKDRFEQAGSALMHALQPFLEDCLLIQAPASAA